MYARSEGSDETAFMRRLVLIFALLVDTISIKISCAGPYVLLKIHSKFIGTWNNEYLFGNSDENTQVYFSSSLNI